MLFVVVILFYFYTHNCALDLRYIIKLRIKLGVNDHLIFVNIFFLYILWLILKNTILCEQKEDEFIVLV